MYDVNVYQQYFVKQVLFWNDTFWTLQDENDEIFELKEPVVEVPRPHQGLYQHPHQRRERWVVKEDMDGRVIQQEEALQLRRW